MKFKDAEPGLFRASNWLVFVKLAEPTEAANAVSVITGKGTQFDGDEEVEMW